MIRKIIFLLLFIVLCSFQDTFARRFIGWESNGDCVPAAGITDGDCVGVCMGGTKSYYFLWIKFETANEDDKCGKVN